MTLPPVPPALVADAVDALPTRLRKRLDDVVTQAAGWPVSTVDDVVTVRVDDATAVTLKLPVGGADDVTCSCLMAPRCAHRAAVLSIAPAGDAPDEPAADPSTAGSEAAAGTAAAAAGAAVVAETAAVAFTDAEVAAAAGLWTAGTALLGRGLAGAGAVRQSVLLRAAHEARSLSLHRASAAAIRVVEGARAARSEDPSFRLAELVAAMVELLSVSHRIRRGVGAPGLRGVARRAYLECGDLRLYGLCCVPVLDATGYAGAVTYLCDAKGRLFQLGDVTPGGLELATGRPGNPVGIGEARLTFRELGRAGLFVSSAKSSADGRLSSGASVKAVRGSGLAWTEAPLAGHWTRPLAEQIHAYHEALRLPLEERPAGHNLAFLTGRMGPLGADEVQFDTAAGDAVRLVPPTDDPGLPYLPNLRMLAEVTGDVRLIGRFAARGRVEALAAGWDALPAEFGGHVDLGVDRIGRTMFPSVPPEPAGTATGGPGTSRPPADLPLYLLSRRVHRAVEGGALAAAGASRDAARLTAAGLPTAAGLAQRLDALAVPRPRDPFGRPVGDGTDELGAAWLSAATYLDVVTSRAAADAWLTAG